MKLHFLSALTFSLEEGRRRILISIMIKQDILLSQLLHKVIWKMKCCVLNYLFVFFDPTWKKYYSSRPACSIYRNHIWIFGMEEKRHVTAAFFNNASTEFILYLFSVHWGFREGSLGVHWGKPQSILFQPSLYTLWNDSVQQLNWVEIQYLNLWDERPPASRNFKKGQNNVSMCII